MNNLLTISPHQMHWLLPGRHDWLPRLARNLNTLNKTSARRFRGSQNTFICQFYVFICLNYENNSVIPNDKVLKKKNSTSKIYLYEEYYFHIIFQLFFVVDFFFHLDTLRFHVDASWRQEEQRWDGWMTSVTRWTWAWARSRSWWWTGKPACSSAWSHKELDTTEQLNWTDENNSVIPNDKVLKKKSNI